MTGMTEAHIMSNVPPVEINEGEGQSHVERGHLVWVGTSLTGLEGNHEVDVAGRSFLLVAVDDLLPEHGAKQTLKRLVNTSKI